jgi:hypothetical protein
MAQEWRSPALSLLLMNSCPELRSAEWYGIIGQKWVTDSYNLSLQTGLAAGAAHDGMGKTVDTQQSDQTHVDMTVRTMQLLMERVYPVLGLATTQVLLAAATKEAAREYPFLHRLPELSRRGELPAHLYRYFPDVTPAELAAAMDVLLREYIATVRELTGDIMLTPISRELPWHFEQPER